MAKVKLVKTGQETVKGLGPMSVERIARTYAVVVDEKPVGYVQQQWGVDYPGARAKVQSFWLCRDNDDKPVGAFGWSDYRDDAVKDVLRAAGVAVTA